jgi:signal transduction histidine kinase
MQRLPHLVASGAVIALPLCGRASAALVAALIAGETLAGDRRRLADALASDAPLALWAACRAAQRLVDPPRSLAALADWLTTSAIHELSLSACCATRGSAEPDEVAATEAAETLENWADLAAHSLCVARLAERIALARNFDGPAAYFLGLLHAAPRWLTASTAGGSEPSLLDVLPSWLRDELRHIEAAVEHDTPGPAGCVAQALAVSGAAAGTNLPGPNWDFDAEAFAREMTDCRQDWLAPGASDQLPKLVAKLARLERLTQQFDQTLENEKLTALKELAQGAGHEINNPLANISARAQTLLPGERDPERRRMLSAIHTQAVRAHEMIADLMLFARPPQPKPEAVDLAKLLGGLVDELMPQSIQQQSELLIQIPASPITAWVDPTQIAVAVRAVCVNALEALVAGGCVEIALIESAPLDDTVQITVSDNGPGISSEVRRHLFDPFYSGREAGRGLGFGLAKCWRIVTLHGGRVEVASTPGCGARFTIFLPKSPAVP